MENARVKYQTAISIHAAEGQIQWNRYNAMLVVNSLFLTFVGSNWSHYISPELLHKGGSIVGFILCLLWFRMTKNGFYWINHWMSMARKIEEQLTDSVGINPINSGNEKKEFRNQVINTNNASYCIIVIVAALYGFIFFTS